MTPAPTAPPPLAGGELATPRDVFSWVESFTNLEKGNLPFDKRNYRLDRMRRLLDLFDDPDRKLSCIHVAGTKGKGSTAALLASVLRAAGHPTGVYLSPHVNSPFERLTLAGEPPRDSLLVGLGRAVRSAIDALPAEGMPGHFAPTTFELYTLLAFLYFREAGCTHAVIEVGIGGRLDATNVILPLASVITPLDMEHTDVLGDTLEKIAAEKAGIIKPEVPAFVGLQPPGVKGVFLRAARERGSPIAFLDEEMGEIVSQVDPEGTTFTVRLGAGRAETFRLAMLGRFQAENAALALLTLRRTMPDLPPACYREGFRRAFLPGRMEVRGRSPAIVLDGAHTPLAVARLLDSFRAVFPGEAVLLFGSVSGKKPKEMAAILARAFAAVIVSTPGTFKESDPEWVAEVFRGYNPATILEKDPARALKRAREEAGGTRTILVTGSFYMIAEIGRLL
jgi:dihydrofolate synthase/folylpolyglutamate synthase